MPGFFEKAVDAGAELLSPTRCVGCDLPGELLCDKCMRELPWFAQARACPNCGAPTGDLTCTECDEPWETRATICAMGFEGPAARMVPALKDYHELRLAPVMASAMLCALEEAALFAAADGRPRFDPRAVDGVCFVPATAAAYRRRGFDHMELVAARLARELGLPLVDALVRESLHDQRDLGQLEREKNLAGSVRTVADVCGMRLLLADDVITTGASVRECARALLARGAGEVTAVSFARVW